MISKRECSRCGELKSLIAFATFKSRDGAIRRRGVCRSCRDKYATENFVKLQEWRRRYNKKNRSAKREKDAQRRAAAKAFVDKHKSERPCADCGRKFPPVAMDLDHVRGAKVHNVSGLVSGAYRMELIVLELEKCDVVCACCHRVRTASRGDHRAPPIAELGRRATGGRRAAKKLTVLR